MSSIKLKIVIPLFFMTLFLNNNAYSLIPDDPEIGIVPQAWLSSDPSDEDFKELDQWLDDEKNLSSFDEDKGLFRKARSLFRLSKGVDNIVESQEKILDEVKPEPKRKYRKPWVISSIKSELAIEAAGTIGVLGLKGEAAVELFWKPRTAWIQRFNRRFENKEKNKVDSSEKSINEDNFISPPSDIEFTDNMTEDDIEKEMQVIVDAAMATGKIKPQARDNFLKNVVNRAKEFHKVGKALSSRPPHYGWWFYQFQLQVKISADGNVLSFMEVGALLRLRFQWRRIQRKVENKSALSLNKDISANPTLNPTEASVAKLVDSLISDFSVLNERTYAKNRYRLKFIKIGVGLNVKGSIYVAKTKGNVEGQLFFKRDLPDLNEDKNTKDFINEKSLITTSPSISNDDYFLMEENETSENQELAKKYNLISIPLEKQNQPTNDKSFGHLKPSSSLYKVNRRHFRRGLRRASKMADFMARRFARSNSSKWVMNVIGLEFEIYLSGGVGPVTLAGKSMLELYLVLDKPKSKN